MIRVDSREQENAHILRALADAVANGKINGYETDKTNIIGDYMDTDRPNIFIERKNSWAEFAGNCGKAHDRFKRELERLDQTGGKLFILIEELTPIEQWKGRHSKMKGEIMRKIIDTWRGKHNIEIVQVDKKDAGNKIIELLQKGGK